MTRKCATAVLISGRGSNMTALAEAAKDPNFPADIKLVISNCPDAAGLQKAQELGIQAMAIDHTSFKSRKAFEQALHAILTEAGIELVCCAGFMRILTSWLTSRWAGKMLNIHPSLLPKYKGLDTHKRALENGDTKHGCTVHYVSEELDGGDIIMQAEIDIHQGDSPDTLAARLIPAEHDLYARALAHTARQLSNAATS